MYGQSIVNKNQQWASQGGGQSNPYNQSQGSQQFLGRYDQDRDLDRLVGNQQGGMQGGGQPSSYISNIQPWNSQNMSANSSSLSAYQQNQQGGGQSGWYMDPSLQRASPYQEMWERVLANRRPFHQNLYNRPGL